MPNTLEYDGRQELERLKKEHRALEKEFARKLARHSEGTGAEKDHAQTSIGNNVGNSLERERAQMSLVGSDRTFEEKRRAQTSYIEGDRDFVEEQNAHIDLGGIAKPITGRSEWLCEDFRTNTNCDWFSFDAVNPPRDHALCVRHEYGSGSVVQAFTQRGRGRESEGLSFDYETTVENRGFDDTSTPTFSVAVDDMECS